jgi:hypothetical protein
MSKTVTAIRFEPDEKDWIEAFANLNGVTFSAQVRQWTLERLEDEMDSRDLQKAIASSRADDKGIGIAELMDKYGIA